MVFKVCTLHACWRCCNSLVRRTPHGDVILCPKALEEEWLAFADASAADIERSTSTRSSTTSISRRHNVDRGDLVEQLPVGEGGKVGDDEEKLEESEVSRP